MQKEGIGIPGYGLSDALGIPAIEETFFSNIAAHMSQFLQSPLGQWNGNLPRLEHLKRPKKFPSSDMSALGQKNSIESKVTMIL